MEPIKIHHIQLLARLAKDHPGPNRGLAILQFITQESVLQQQRPGPRGSTRKPEVSESDIRAVMGTAAFLAATQLLAQMPGVPLLAAPVRAAPAGVAALTRSAEGAGSLPAAAARAAPTGAAATAASVAPAVPAPAALSESARETEALPVTATLVEGASAAAEAALTDLARETEALPVRTTLVEGAAAAAEAALTGLARETEALPVRATLVEGAAAAAAEAAAPGAEAALAKTAADEAAVSTFLQMWAERKGYNTSRIPDLFAQMVAQLQISEEKGEAEDDMQENIVMGEADDDVPENATVNNLNYLDVNDTDSLQATSRDAVTMTEERVEQRATLLSAETPKPQGIREILERIQALQRSSE